MKIRNKQGWMRLFYYSKEWLLSIGLPASIVGILFIGFFAYPLSDVVWTSFNGSDFNFAGYQRMLDTESGPYMAVFSRTFVIAFWSTVLCVCLGYPVAYFMSTARPLVVAGMVTMLAIPLFTAILIRTYAWIIIFGRKGLINTVLGGLGILDQPLNILYTGFAVYVGMINVLLPVAVFTMYATMVQIDRQIVLAAEVLGARPAKAFTRVYFPLSVPGVLAASVLVFILSIGFYITPALLGGTSDTMISQLIITQTSILLNLEFGYVLATSLLIATLLILTLAGTVVPLESLWSVKLDQDAAVSVGNWRMRVRAPSGVRALLNQARWARRLAISWVELLFISATAPFVAHQRFLLRLFVGGMLLFLVAPLPIVVLVSFSSSAYLVFPPPGFSLEWYWKFFTSDVWRTAVLMSVGLGLAASLLAVFAGTAGAFLVVRRRIPGKRAVFFLMIGPLMTPHIIMAIAFYGHFLDLGLLGSFSGLIIGHTVMATPYAVIVMTTALRGFDVDLERAAESLGAGRILVFRKITLPLLAPALLTSALLAFLVSFDELIVTLFLLGRLPRTLPLQFWADITIAIDPVISAASSMIVAGVIAMVIGAQWYRSRVQKRTGSWTGATGTAAHVGETA